MYRQKVRDIRNEHKYSFFWNFAVVFIILVAAGFVFPQCGPIGRRTMTALYLFDGALMFCFMVTLEKYTVTISGLYEKLVITLLSSAYTFIVMCLINLIFFSSAERLAADAVIAAAKSAAVFLVDLVLKCIYKSFKKPRMLIIDSDTKNFYRMKRIKYGVLKNYDSWYENLSGVSEEEYHIAVSAAVEMNKDLFIVPKMIDVGKTNARLARFDDVLTMYMPKTSLTYIELFIKRAIDIFVSLAGLIVSALPMLIIAAAIKITSPGPVFYKQTRLTKNKKEFEIYKFRTMVPDAEKLSGPKFAEKNDPRITSVGKILRSSRLDELPQLINILKGDMSVVGPRPERPVFVRQFEQEIENYDYRFEVKAGLTSLSHVYGRYSTYIHDRTYYDLFYITHYSLMLDLKIILLTTKTVFLKSAAEGEDDFKEKTVAENNREADAVEKTK